MSITSRDYKIDEINDKIYVLDDRGKIIRTYELYRVIDDISALVFDYNSPKPRLHKLVFV